MQITSSHSISTAYSQQPYQAKTSVDAQAEKTAPAKTESPKEDKQQAQQIQRQIEILKARDREVRSHEQAHLTAAGGLAIGGASFEFVTGPDGQRYAVGGEVSIDTSGVPGDPEATLRKAETIRRAALAPARPSSQDYSVASKATAMANQARLEMLRASRAVDSKGVLLDVNA
ncbi:MAG: hypothetical protein CTY19_00090 [Methylomonas sp.]|jgi:hypothetical protein|nr:MAG: hypothetical protein CTY19_00090 [Methylomonas sp.]